MNPKRRLRQLRDDARWTDMALTPANVRAGSSTAKRGVIRTGIALLIAVTVVVGLWAGLTGLRGAPPAAGPTPTRSAEPTSSPTLEPIIEPSPISTRTYPATPLAGGCPANTAKVPVGAVTATISDVDGDGQADTEWTAFTTSGAYAWGIRTASGAVIRQDLSFASAGERSISIGTLKSGQSVALASDGRSVELYVLHGCRWTQPENSDFGMGYGEPVSDTGAGCIDGTLYAFSRTPTPIGNAPQVTYSGEPVRISSSARTVARGPSQVFARLLANATNTVVGKFGGSTCGPSARIVPTDANK